MPCRCESASRPSKVLARAVVLLALAAHSAVAQRPADVRIVDFRPENGTLVPGAVAESGLAIENDGPTRMLWIGYSVEDPAGRWYDVEPHSIEVVHGGRSLPQRKQWTVPTSPLPMGGEYRVVMAVWSAAPGTEGAQRLASVERRASFRVDVASVPFGPSGAWQRGDHRLGRGRVDPSLATAVDSGFQLSLSPNGRDGSEVRTLDRLHFARVSARMRTPNAPGSLSALFFYADTPGGNDELDIEIYNDGTRRAILTAWVAGKRTRGADILLPFDPTAAHHEYTIDWTNDAVAFFADDKQLARWPNRFPKEPMRLMVNLWRPTWIDGDSIGDPPTLDVASVAIRRPTR